MAEFTEFDDHSEPGSWSPVTNYTITEREL